MGLIQHHPRIFVSWTAIAFSLNNLNFVPFRILVYFSVYLFILFKLWHILGRELRKHRLKRNEVPALIFQTAVITVK